MSRLATSIAASAAITLFGASAHATLATEGCPTTLARDVERQLALDLDQPDAHAISMTCSDREVVVEVGGAPARTVRLADMPARGRARAVALVIVELVRATTDRSSEPREEAELPTPPHAKPSGPTLLAPVVPAAETPLAPAGKRRDRLIGLGASTTVLPSGLALFGMTGKLSRSLASGRAFDLDAIASLSLELGSPSERPREGKVSASTVWAMIGARARRSVSKQVDVAAGGGLRAGIVNAHGDPAADATSLRGGLVQSPFVAPTVALSIHGATRELIGVGASIEAGVIAGGIRAQVLGATVVEYNGPFAGASVFLEY